MTKLGAWYCDDVDPQPECTCDYDDYGCPVRAWVVRHQACEDEVCVVARALGRVPCARCGAPCPVPMRADSHVIEYVCEACRKAKL